MPFCTNNNPLKMFLTSPSFNAAGAYHVVLLVPCRTLAVRKQKCRWGQHKGSCENK
ncbi:transmembrane protein, putative [Bodo saltans]|uniref:Transmembrane protein, putative n=1 Tax=Bodo saltans TaxID=75058 RepID=A0A0S4KF89_BODSA|nr:transmembrane protein, putative [Bodo saltans]|eukprot:CUI14263.1 transmembrane protein, putative [Bodo saltans]